MAKKKAVKTKAEEVKIPAGKPFDKAQGRPSAVVDTRVIYCGDNLGQFEVVI